MKNYSDGNSEAVKEIVLIGGHMQNKEIVESIEGHSISIVNADPSQIVIQNLNKPMINVKEYWDDDEYVLK